MLVDDNLNLYFAFVVEVQMIIIIWVTTQVDQNGVVYGPFSDRKCCKNGVFTAVYSVNTVRFRPVSIRIHGRRNTDRIVAVS